MKKTNNVSKYPKKVAYNLFIKNKHYGMAFGFTTDPTSTTVTSNPTTSSFTC